jgi:ornithine carbamoyltransferase
MLKSKHLLTLGDIASGELLALVDAARKLKKQRGAGDAPQPLSGKSIGMIFSKASTRTRVSFEVGIHELGGQALILGMDQLQLGRGETVADTARVLSRYLHGIVIRSHEHSGIEEFAENATIPVINGLTDRFHPCQLVADLQTIAESAGRLEGVSVAYLGDGASNMANSWAIAARLSGIELRIGAPDGYQPEGELLRNLSGPGTVTVTDDPVAAAKDVDFVYTDVWVSMGFEEEAGERLATMQPYQVNDALLSHAADDAKVLHCLPAYRGKEITADVVDGPRSLVWDQAENRLHAQKAVLSALIK